MKRTIAALLLLSVLALPAYAATGGGTMEVRVWVLGGCNFVSPADVILDFGKLTGGNRTVSANAGITCSNGTRFNISLDQGQNAAGSTRRMAQQGGTGRLPYLLTASPMGGQSSGGRIDIRLEAKVYETDYLNLPQGNYQDTVVMKIDP